MVTDDCDVTWSWKWLDIKNNATNLHHFVTFAVEGFNDVLDTFL